MKNIGASVSAVLTAEKKEAEVEKVVVKEEVKEERMQKENEMIFFLREAPKYCISAIGKWYENTSGEVIGDVDTYFLHILTGSRCETVEDCFAGWSEQDEKSAEEWETLCERIENLGNIDEYICNEKSVGL